MRQKGTGNMSGSQIIDSHQPLKFLGRRFDEATGGTRSGNIEQEAGRTAVFDTAYLISRLGHGIIIGHINGLYRHNLIQFLFHSRGQQFLLQPVLRSLQPLDFSRQQSDVPTPLVQR